MQDIDKNEFRRRVLKIVIITLSVAVIGVVLLILALNGLRIPCIFNEITGLDCPGCGNTRAVVSIFRLDFKKAFEYNQLFFLEIFYIGWVYFFSAVNYMKRKRFSYQSPCAFFDIFVLVCIVLWGIVRNIFF